MKITVIDNALCLRAYKLLKSCKKSLRMCDAYMKEDKSLGFTFMALAYTDYSHLKSIDSSNKLNYTPIYFTPFFIAFDNYKNEVEVLITGSKNLTYSELRSLYQKLYKASSQLEEQFEENLNDPTI